MRVLAVLFLTVALAACATRINPASPQYARPATSQGPTIHSFGAAGDGVWPTTDMIYYKSSSGMFYGTTYGGGSGGSGACASGCGTVYAISTGGSESILYSFKGAPDGAIPEGGIVQSGANLYGTTFYGGKSNSQCADYRGCGTIFELSTSGSEQVLHSFTGGTDGTNPAGKLRNLNGTPKGALYGTTSGGLVERGCAGERVGKKTYYGTLFQIDPSGSNYKTLHDFSGAPADGACPVGDIAAIGNVIYGVTYEGGKDNAGAVYAITPGGSEHVVCYLDAATGDYPVGLVQSQSVLYGAASADGPNSRGTIFSCKPGNVKPLPAQVLYSFKGSPLSDGALPYSPPLATHKKLYGTTEGGGKYGVGTLYEFDPVSKQDCIVYNFGHDPDGNMPGSAVYLLGNELYGTTILGGDNGLGTAYRIPFTSCLR